jgi:hypothetical protein
LNKDIAAWLFLAALVAVAYIGAAMMGGNPLAPQYEDDAGWGRYS